MTPTARFVLSTAAASDFPGTGLPEIALVGRSHVGKSSLINALVKKTVARTSAAAGKTRLANYYLIGDAYHLVDLPGYGYARGGYESVEAFETLTREYFNPSSRPGRRIVSVLHLIDARHPDLPQDRAAYEWLLRTGLPVYIVATKMDKLKSADQARTLTTLSTAYDSPVIAESVLDRTGIDEVAKVIRGILHE